MQQALRKIMLGLCFGGLISANVGQAIEFDACQQENSAPSIYGAECATLDVPLNHDDPDSANISVHFMRIASISDSKKPPLFFIAGGPGQAAGDLAKTFRHQFSQLLVDHDFIFVDQRGAGKSHALNCDMNSQAISDLSASQVRTLAIEQHRACLQTYEADPSFFLTTDAVRDLELVRKSLDYDTIYLWGGSYGTRVVLEYLRLNQDVLGGVVMDGLAPTHIRLPAHSEHDANRALKKIFARCKNRKTCGETFTNLQERWVQLLAERKAKPLTITLEDPRSEKEHKVYVDHVSLSSWARASLYNRELSALLPLAIHEATQEQYATLYSMQALGFDEIEKSISEGLHLSILCAEDRSYRGTTTIKDPDSELIYIAEVVSIDEICELYPKRQLADDYFAPTKSHVPTLLLSGDYDPVTPPRWGESVDKNLSNSKHVIVPGGHHIVSSLGCIPNVIARFFEKPEAIESLDITCVDNIKPLDFFIDGAGPNMESDIHASEGQESL